MTIGYRQKQSHRELPRRHRPAAYVQAVLRISSRSWNFVLHCQPIIEADFFLYYSLMLFAVSDVKTIFSASSSSF